MIAKKKIWGAVAITIVATGMFAAYYLFPKDPDRAFLNRAATGWSYARGYFAGMGWAKADIEEDRALILGAGTILDQKTGLHTWDLDCTRDRGMEGVAAGYNRIVRLWVYLKGSPQYSRKRWESTLFHLTEYFNSKARTVPPERFIVDGPPIIASDGVTRVSLKQRPRKDAYLVWEAGNTSRFWSPLPKKGRIEAEIWPLMTKDGVLFYYPGPSESDLLLFRGRAGHSQKEMTAAFDMRYGHCLIYEPARWYPYFPGDENYTK